MKMVIRMCLLMLVLVAGGTVYAAAEGDLTIGTTKPGVTVALDRVLSEGRALTSVNDATKQPVLGLGIRDQSWPDMINVK